MHCGIALRDAIATPVRNAGGFNLAGYRSRG
jgi:hypothetical protein